jgi:amidophosphoribosyltransferase
MIKATGKSANGFCMACYDGNYPVPYDPMVDKHIMERRRARTEGLLPAIEHAEQQPRLFEN